MAKPIEPTPVLKGEDAKALLEEIEHARFSPEKAEEKRQAMAAYEKYIKKRR
ncbi:MAG: hypothetical protein PHF51_00200 [Candidatus ainarchaeum sp.]|nr:hypothetical protein [Candidatus ainarchaeum sp.]